GLNESGSGIVDGAGLNGYYAAGCVDPHTVHAAKYAIQYYEAICSHKTEIRLSVSCLRFDVIEMKEQEWQFAVTARALNVLFNTRSEIPVTVSKCRGVIFDGGFRVVPVH